MNKLNALIIQEVGSEIATRVILSVMWSNKIDSIVKPIKLKHDVFAGLIVHQHHDDDCDRDVAIVTEALIFYWYAVWC